MDPSLQAVLNNINSGTVMPATAKYIQYSPSDIQTSSTSDLMQRAFNELKPYYAKLLQDANHDLDTAKGYLEQDYQQGTRYTQEDLESSLKQLNVSMPQEQEQQKESLNQRGIALTQDQSGKIQYGQEGLAKSETQMLSEDQALRKEAAQRTAQRQTTQLGQTRQRGLESATRQAQMYGEQLQQDIESQATSRAGLYANLEQQGNAAGLQNKVNQASLAGGAGGTPTTATLGGSNNFMDYYKGWDPTSAQADFSKTYSGDLGKLQSSKPL